MRDSIDTLVLTLRWIQWVLSAYSFGVCLTYFLIDVNWYFWISPMVRPQLALAGTLHIYLYLAAIWISIKPQAPLAWAILDIAFAALAIATAVTGQSSISEYCSPGGLLLFWSKSQLAYVPEAQLTINDYPLDLGTAEYLEPPYLQRACGFHASVIAANGIIVLLLIVTVVIQTKQHRMDYREYEQCLTQSEKPQAQQSSWQKNAVVVFSGHNTAVDV